jgi:prevent-host-death family protein
MSKAINIHEAKTHLSRLVEQAAAGREFMIAKAGKPRARLVPLALPVRARMLCLVMGRIRVPDHFNAPPGAATLALFEGT